MLQYLLDSDHLTLYEHGHALVTRRVRSRPPGEVGITVVTVEEALRGRLAKVARAADGPSRIHQYDLLEKTIQFITQFQVASYDQRAEDEFQQLRSIRIGTQDLKIVSIARANGVTLVTRNRRDFGRVPGLTLEDWSV
jgi:tRNA(fMet)-specific endonuclease VapC